jgi:hypothetical protein
LDQQPLLVQQQLILVSLNPASSFTLACLLEVGQTA